MVGLPSLYTELARLALLGVILGERARLYCSDTYLFTSFLMRLVKVCFAFSPLGIEAFCKAIASFLAYDCIAASFMKTLPMRALMSSEAKLLAPYMCSIDFVIMGLRVPTLILYWSR